MTTKTNKELRKFGLVFFGYCIFLISILPILHHHAMPLWGWSVVTCYLMIVFFLPKFLRPLNSIYTILFGILHWLNTRILFGIIFFFIFTPVALLRRALKKDVLDLDLNEKKITYRSWVKNNESNDLRKPF